MRIRLLTPTFAASLVLLVSSAGAAAIEGAPSSRVGVSLAPGNAPPPAQRHRVPLSAAYERMLRDQIAAGRVLDPRIIERFGLESAGEPDFEAAIGDALRGPESTGGLQPFGPGVALRPDSQVNNKIGDVTCASGCSNRPLGQAETTIATLGNNALAGWNNTKGFCTGGAIQGYAYSTNGGVTWTDAGDPPALPSGGRYRGDPVHAVNRSTGAFYILGLYEGGVPGSGLALARGHFSGASFVIDDNRQIAVGGANFLDKEWMAVDPGSGNLYVSYSNFVGGSIGQIEFIRSQDNGLTWSAPIVLNAPASNGNVQGSRPVVGPGGELYVAWYDFGFPQSHMRIRRSDDLGATFGPERTICDFYENYYSGAPGFRRGFGIALPSIAVDGSNGAHRGRVYVSWDESVNFNDAPAPLGAKSEVENNSNFANATPFTVGDVVRGALATTADIDMFRFSGVRGQTVYFRADSATTAANATLQLRILCASDTSNLDNYRFLANDIAGFPALAFTLPANGTYYLRMQFNVGPAQAYAYRILTSFDTPSAGERARDHRDSFVAHSDDGTTWSTPVRVTDSDPWFDGEFAEITVDGTGAAHCYWHDFRDDPGCGAESYEYLVSSGDGGVTWGPNRRVSDARSFWSSNACGSANHGDYQGITSEGNTVYPTWADSRLGDPDVWSEGARFDLAAGCEPDLHGAAGSSQSLDFTLGNPGNVDGRYGWTLTESRNWITSVTPSSSGTTALVAGGSLLVQASIQVPASCPDPNADTLRFIIHDLDIPGRQDTCVTLVYCVSATGAPGAPAARLYFAPPHPNPSARGTTLRFGLSREGAARLDVYAANGARVRTLVSGRQPAGERRIAWDGRDAQGRRLGAGVYYAALEAEGQRLRRPLIVLP